MDEKVVPEPVNINIELPEDVAEGHYSNLAIIQHSNSEFIIDFVRLMPGVPKAKVKSRILLTPQHAKRLMKALKDNLARFEQLHGPVQDTEVNSIPMNFGDRLPKHNSIKVLKISYLASFNGRDVTYFVFALPLVFNKLAFLKHTKRRIGEFILLRQYNDGTRRHREIMNIERAKKIGIIYSADKKEDEEEVLKYSEILRGMGKNVTTLGFFNTKEPPKNITESADRQYFALKDTNWYFKPFTSYFETFMKEDFDLLLNFDIYWQLSLLFICSQSAAKCRVGRYSEKFAAMFDVMIETDDNKNLDYFINNTDTYLQMLNKPTSN